jgi:hypothetical protein
MSASGSKSTSGRATTAPLARGDFGVPADKPAAQRAVSRRIRAQHPGEHSESGDVQPRAGTETREAGVGGQEAGPGSFSGGDVDPSVVGVGFQGSGIAAAGPDDESGPASAARGPSAPGAPSADAAD